LQIGIVLEEVVEARAYEHYRHLPDDERDDRIDDLLANAREESAEHRERLASLVDHLSVVDADVDVTDVVHDHYARTDSADFDGVLYDQLNGEETAYKFYDDLIDAIEGSDAAFGVNRTELLATLRDIRAAEAAGVEAVAGLMEDRT